MKDYLIADTCSKSLFSYPEVLPIIKKMSVQRLPTFSIASINSVAEHLQKKKVVMTWYSFGLCLFRTIIKTKLSSRFPFLKKYSRTSVARTLMTCLQQLFQPGS